MKKQPRPGNKIWYNSILHQESHDDPSIKVVLKTERHIGDPVLYPAIDAGREAVQVYVSAPEGSIEKPQEELVAFAKTALLRPGLAEKLTFTIDASLLASFDENNSGWIVEAGEYTLKVGASCRDIRETATFTVAQDIDAGHVTKALVPQQDFTRLHK